MNLSSTILAVLTFGSMLMWLGSEGLAQGERPSEIPDFTQGDTIPNGFTHDWNLGPTGARGWIYSNRLETTEARQILITTVAPSSPADGKLLPGDVLLGVDGDAFSYDPRTELGKAITKAESGNRKLKLMCWRSNGKRASIKSVVLRLQKTGAYSNTAPFACRKSKRIFERGCEALAQQMEDNPKAGNGITRSLNALALLSSGQRKYLPLVRQQVAWAAKFSDPESRMLHSWFYGPINILLAEYTLATGDKTFLPDLERITMEIVRGQSKVGTWGHRFSRPDGRLNGYGMMNAPGLPMTISLVLARKAGVANAELDEAIEKSARLMRFYAGKGCVPYGDHAPWIETHDDNGKNGAAAVLFNLLEEPETAEFFSRMSVASHGAERELGHTGNFFNMLWAMPGVALSGPEASGAWMEEFGWYYDLARQWDGTFLHQGPPEPKHDSYHEWDATGAYLLAYGQSLRKIYLTGRQDGIVSKISRQTADSLIDDGRDYSHRREHLAYEGRDVAALFEGLSSWSPIVRERSAIALETRNGNHVPKLIKMLDGPDLHAQIGACQALAQLKQHSEPALDALERLLNADDLWLRVKAAEAIAAVGKPGHRVAPKLLQMLAQGPSETDPRAMEQRFLCFALFNSKEGMLSRSLDGIDRESLFRAVRSGLENEDGRARGAIASTYRNLSYDEIELLLPSIHRAVVEPSPSGVMFADNIRIAGLKVLAKHRIEEGMLLCIDVVEFDRWGESRRFKECLEVLQSYGGAAKRVLPRLKELETQMVDQQQPKAKPEELELLRTTVSKILADENPPSLRSITAIKKR